MSKFKVTGRYVFGDPNLKFPLFDKLIINEVVYKIGLKAFGKKKMERYTVIDQKVK